MKIVYGMDAAWQAWATRWADMRTGIYRLENLLDGAGSRGDSS